MQFLPTPLKGAYLVRLEPRGDTRGWFTRVLCTRALREAGLEGCFVQMNHSLTRRRGTIRGLHYQLPPAAEVKLMRCIRGAIFDVIVDLRAGSPTFLQWFGAELRAGDHRMLYVSAGFAHGFQTLEDDAEVMYPASSEYTPELERGVHNADPRIGIRWPIGGKDIETSEKDATLTSLAPDFPGVTL